MMPRRSLSTVDTAGCDRPVRIAVLVVRGDKAEAVKVTGSVCTAVRAAFAHPRLAAPLQALQMDADRLIRRIVSRWENSGDENETQQLWVKSDGSTTVRWWVDRNDVLAPEVRPA